MNENNEEQEETKSQINYYKMIFQKHNKYPVGLHSRNLRTKIKDNQKILTISKENNKDFFNPISDNNTLKIKKLYSKFQKIKSAKKNINSSYNCLTPKNLIINKKYENSFSRPLSQNITFMCLSKNKSTPFFRNTPKTRPISQTKNFTLFFDNFSNNSKMAKYTKKKKFKILKQKPILINKKNNRSSSALIFKKKDEDFFNNSKIKDLIKKEKEIEKKKKRLKGRLLTSLSKHLVMNKEMYNKYNHLFKNEEDSENKKLNIENEKKINSKKMFYLINNFPNFFSEIKPSFRYEDCSYTPLEFLIKYFTKEELILIKSSPDYFGLKKLPFKNSDFEFYPTLLSRIENEENGKDLDNSKRIEKFVDNKYNKINIKNEMNKIKKVFNQRKQNIVKKKLLKGKDFVSHYEREVEPDEGTVEYFERKYIKYMNNKEKRMEKKISNIQYKKNQFEYLKNQRTKKLDEDKSIQRITGPVINIIRKNYIRTNNIVI